MSLSAIRTAAACAGIAGFFIAAPVLASADGNYFSGTVSTVTSCDNMASSSLVLLQSGAKYAYQSGFSRSLSVQAAPQPGENIYGVYENGPYCFSSVLGNTTESILFYATSSPTVTSAVQPAASAPQPPSSGSNPISSLTSGANSSLFSSIKTLLSGLFPGSKKTTQAQAPAASGGSAGSGGGSGSSGGGAGIGIFGGTISMISLCDEGFLYMVAGSPYSGPLMWVDGASAVPPYLYAMGTPPVIGNIIGHYTGFSPCTIDGTPVPPGGGPVMFGYGTGLGGGGGSAPSQPSKPTSLPKGGGMCNNPVYDAYTQQALEKYGPNLLSGNVAGLSNVCPNYQNLSETQRLGFWTNFVDAVEKPESGCRIQTSFPESNGQLSNGLLSMSLGDSAPGIGSCFSSEAQTFDPQSNINCGVAKMNQY
ncbi:MAG: hypothetical protein KGI73_02140, partial [Patescibacteria group bacterium]|nr:hypothetical protein [Patescibacteria group bacterium]